MKGGEGVEGEKWEHNCTEVFVFFSSLSYDKAKPVKQALLVRREYFFFLVMLHTTFLDSWRHQHL